MTLRILTQSDVKAKLNYDESTGLFTWINSDSPLVKNGSVAGNVNRNGYCYIGLYREVYRAHRLAWLYVTGKNPTRQIDHINGNKSDNRFANLREASNLKNTRNRNLNSNNKSGYRGVSWAAHANKWVAHVMAKGKRKKLGYYKTALSASKAFQAYAKKNHGEFYKPSE
jgi:hypothetical protein